MPSLDVRYLEYFAEAAHTGSFTAAARRLFVSQQALSKGIGSLETDLGIQLFTRSKAGVGLTPFGERFLERVMPILTDLKALREMADQCRLGAGSSLSVGITAFCFAENGGTVDSSVLLAFKESHPLADCRFVELSGDAIVHGVLSGETELGLGVGPETGVKSILLFDFPMAALLLREHDFFRDKGVARISDLSRSNLVSLANEQEFNASLLRRAERDHIRIGVSSLQVSAGHTIRSALERGEYIIRPLQHALRTITDDAIRVIPIVGEDGAPVVTSLSVFWRNSKTLTDIENEFVEAIVRLYRETHPAAATSRPALAPRLPSACRHLPATNSA